MSNELQEPKETRREKESFPWQYILFLGCALVAVPVYFALGTISTESLYNRHTFYVILEVSSYMLIVIVLVMCLIFKRNPLKDFVFYRNMDRWASAWVGLGIGGILGLEYFVMPLLRQVGSTFTYSLVLNIAPIQPVGLPASLAWIPQPVSNLVQQLLWQILSVGHSEEIFKVALIVMGVAIFRSGWKVAIIMFVADIVWGCAHAMVAYGGDLTAIAMAIIVGLVFLVQLIGTRSVMVPIITHGIINVLLTLGSMGFTWATLTGAGASQMIVLVAQILAAQSAWISVILLL